MQAHSILMFTDIYGLPEAKQVTACQLQEATLVEGASGHCLC